VKQAAVALAVLVTACGGATTTGSSTTTAHLEPSSTLPGVPAESTLAAGDVVGVIGASAAAAHWLVEVPGGDLPDEVVRELSPLETGLEALGAAREVDEVLWERLRLDDDEGWFPRPMLAFVGDAEDVTALYVAVDAVSVEELGAEIAGEIEATEIVLTNVTGPLEVTYDVLGLEDDSVAGFRIRVVAGRGW
jgi:hypothetical protein